jgi:hypothetical protein
LPGTYWGWVKPPTKKKPKHGTIHGDTYPIGSMYGIYANIGGILMVNVTIYSIHGSYGYGYMGIHMGKDMGIHMDENPKAYEISI